MLSCPTRLTGYGAQGITVTTALAVVQPGDERSFAYVAATRGTDTNMIRVVTETLDDEPAGHHPQRSARDVLGEVLANDPAVTAGQALDAAAARQYDAAELFNRHRHTTRTLAEHTLRTVLEARGATELLDARPTPGDSSTKPSGPPTADWTPPPSSPPPPTTNSPT